MSKNGIIYKVSNINTCEKFPCPKINVENTASSKILSKITMSKIEYFVENSIFRRKFDISSKIRYCIENSIFRRKFDIASKIRYCVENSILRRKFYISSKIRYFVENSILRRSTLASKKMPCRTPAGNLIMLLLG